MVGHSVLLLQLGPCRLSLIQIIFFFMKWTLEECSAQKLCLIGQVSLFFRISSESRFRKIESLARVFQHIWKVSTKTRRFCGTIS